MNSVLFTRLVKEQVFAKVDLNIHNFKAAFINGNTYFKACDWKWIEISRLLTIRDNNGLIGGVFYDKSDLSAWDYMIRDYDASDTDVLALDNFHWLIGTYKEANTDFVYKGNDEREKLPMLWFSLTPTPSTTENDVMNPVQFVHDFTLFFCASVFFSEFKTEDVLDSQINALNEYVNAFIEAIVKNREYFGNANMVTHRRHYFPKFGQFKGENGNSIIDSQLSAIEVNMTLNVKRSCKC